MSLYCAGHICKLRNECLRVAEYRRLKATKAPVHNPEEGVWIVDEHQCIAKKFSNLVKTK